MRRPRLVALAAAAALAATVVAGCSSGSGSESAGDGGAETSAEADGEPVGDAVEGDGIEITDENLNMLAPIVIVPEQTEAEANVGDALDIMVDDPVAATVESDAPDIVEVFNGSDQDGVVMNPGGVALAAGTANITVVNADGTSYVIVVNVSE